MCIACKPDAFGDLDHKSAVNCEDDSPWLSTDDGLQWLAGFKHTLTDKRDRIAGTSLDITDGNHATD